MRHHLVLGLGLVATLGALSAACGTTNPPEELVNARATYDRAQKGPAAQYKPDELHIAHESLTTAEQSFSHDGASQKTKDLAYIAGLRSEVAEADARAAIAASERRDDEKKAQSSLTEQARNAQRELASTREQLQSERQKREDAEKKAAQAAADLQRIAAVKQEARGMVITLSGAVLFGSGQSALLPSAMVKLNDVADALVKGNPESRIVVEGHTDSQGSASFNQDLSVRRAQSVRDYLASRGIASDRITADGLGSSRPVASNTSPEGRADNRRVEIVVQPSGSP